jgi:prepilin-type N-terminal cleavage/methylation domain-containing protein
MRAQRGFTLVEMAVAMTILAAGSAVLWYGLKASAKMDRLNRLHHAAILLARSDLESLRSVPKQDIHDTIYLGPGAGAESLLVVRRVMDSARIVATSRELVLDEKLSPKDLRKPLEVRVQVFRRPNGNGNGEAAWDPSAFGDPSSFPAGESGPLGSDEDPEAAGKGHPLTSLILMLPEYKWY